MKVSIDILSGSGEKAAAAILLTYQAGAHSKPIRFLLDAGGALEVGEEKGWEQPDNLDAIFISHDHQDHMGGLIDVDGQVPVYATSPVQKQLPRHLNLYTLPICGVTNVCGIKVTTGSAGHSFGGVWFHIDVGDGVIYSGDFSFESTLYTFDMPPKASIALLDASYGLYEHSLDQCKNALLNYLNDKRALLMPVPQTGRSLEMACWLASLGFQDWSLGNDCITPETVLAGPKGSVRPEIRPTLENMDCQAFDADKKVVLCGDPDGMSGDSALLLQHTEKYLPIYTGHLPEKARVEVSEGRAYFQRWNVHPRTQDLKLLIDYLECQLCAPLFHSLDNLDDWQKALGTSVSFDAYMELIYEFNC